MPPRATDAAPKRQRKIVELLCRHVLEGLGIREIARRLDYSEPNVVRDLKDLMADGYVRKLESGKYALTAKLPGLLTACQMYFDDLKFRSENFQTRILAQARQMLD